MLLCHIYICREKLVKRFALCGTLLDLLAIFKLIVLSFITELLKLQSFLIIWQLENQKSTLEFWERSLNPLTWTEILRQVLVAAGFGSKQGAMRKEVLSKVF